MHYIPFNSIAVVMIALGMCRSLRRDVSIRKFINLALFNRPQPHQNIHYMSSTAEKIELENPIFRERILFTDFMKPSLLSEALTTMNKTIATDIQHKSYPAIMKGDDVIIGAETGSGKTLAYTIPILAKYALDKTESTYRGIILAPTSELCKQIVTMTSDLYEIVSTEEKKVKLDPVTLSFYDWLEMKDKLHTVISTPRLIADAIRDSDHRNPEHPFRALDFLVLDEADMLLDGSYRRDVEIILDTQRLVRRAMINDGILTVNAHKTQFILAAATIPTFGVKSIHNFIQDTFPNAVTIRSENLHQHHPSIEQSYHQIPDGVFMTKQHVDMIIQQLWDKDDTHTPHDDIAHLPYSTMIFLNTAQNAQKFHELLQSLGYTSITEFHGLLRKEEREYNLMRFRRQDVNILICTDACARGLDLPHVKRVIQAEFALNVVQHQHRVGRCSRGGKSGVAINFYDQARSDLVHSISSVGSVGRSSESDSANDNEEDEKSSIEKSFSRRRGFRAKIKKAAAAVKVPTELQI